MKTKGSSPNVLNKRERFASSAMQGLASLPNAWAEKTIREQCNLAVEYADELIRALNLNKPQS